MKNRKSAIERAKELVPFFAQRYEIFVKRLENESASSHTITNYGHHLALLCLNFGRLPGQISTLEYTDYYNMLLKKKSSGSHMKHAVFAVRKYFHVVGHPCPLAANPKIPKTKSLPVVLNEQELVELLRHAGGLRNQVLLALLYDSGIRRSELCNLQLRDLDFNRSSIHICMGKGNKDRYVPFSKKMQQAMEQYLALYAPKVYVFEGKPGEPIPYAWPSKILKEALRLTSIRKDVSCHVLRHSFATHLLEHNVDLRSIQKWLGHSRLDTTAVYLNVARTNYSQDWQGPLSFLYPAE